MSTLVRRIVLLALAGGILFDVLVPGNAAGLNAVIVTAAFLAGAMAVAGRDGLGRMDPADAWLAPIALVFAAMPAIRADDWLVTWDVLFAMALAAGFIGCLAGARITRGLVPQVVELSVGLVATAVVGTAGLLIGDRPAAVARVDPVVPGRTSQVRGRLGRAAPVGRGLLIALPLVAIFVALFASADAVFARLAADLVTWRPDVDLADVLVRVLVVSVVAWGAAGLLGMAAGMLPALTPAPAAPSAAAAAAASAGTGSAPSAAMAASAAMSVSAGGARTSPASPEPPSPPPHPAAGAGAATWPGATGWQAPARADTPPLRLGTTEAATILVVVDLLFGVFVGLQVAYLFGGRDTLGPSGLTYADYARRGFFELVLVALLAGMLVVALDLAVGRRSRSQLAGSLVLLGLTSVVLVSALLRIRLYQAAYGWTELRFVVLTAIAWLAVALVVAAVLLLTRQTRWVLHALGIMVLVTLAGMNVLGPQQFVTERNLERAIDPSLVPAGGRSGLDSAYLAGLGDEAVVPVVDAWDRLRAADRAALAPALEWRRTQLATDPSLQGWAAWNLTRTRARAALESLGASGR